MAWKIIMTDKAKRKGNPRRRVLFNLLMMSVLLIATVSASWYLLQSSPERIVYIAEDENGYENIFIVNLNGTNNPKQLTYHDQPVRMLHASPHQSTIIYTTSDRMLWSMNANTGEAHSHGECNCGTFQISPSGEWLAYEIGTRTEFEGEVSYHVLLRIQNLKTGHVRTVEEFEFVSSSWSGRPYYWVDGNLLAYTNYPIDGIEQISVYDVEREIVIEETAFSTDYHLLLYRNFQAYNPRWTIYKPTFYSEMLIASSVDTDINIAIPQNTIERSAQDVTHRDMIWHPTIEDQFITIDSWYSRESQQREYNLVLYKLEDQSSTILSSISQPSEIWRISFNSDGTKLMWQLWNNNTSEIQYFVRDMTTGTIQSIPIEGYYPMWVGG
ncbi:MAG: hypothetical protein AAF846_29750 [Chloroflexota bacterium]